MLPGLAWFEAHQRPRLVESGPRFANGLRKLASARLIMSGAGWRHMHERAIETTLGRLLQTMVVPLP